MDQLLTLLEDDQIPEIKRTYVTVILPLPLPKLYTYSVPFHYKDSVARGIRVEVQFGRNRRYSGVIFEVHSQAPEDYAPKPILSVLDETRVVTDKQFKLWEWMSTYYVSTIGEVMNASLPAGLKLASETKIVLHPNFEESQIYQHQLNNKESFIIEHLVERTVLTLDDIQKLIKQKTVYPIVKKLIEKQIVFIQEELKAKYKPKTVDIIHLAEPYNSDSTRLKEAFELIGKRANRQMETLMAFLQLSKQTVAVEKTALYEKANVDSTVIRKLVQKGIFELEQREVSRLDVYEGEAEGNFSLSDMQKQALDSIKTEFEDKNVVLLHGVTGSGKTQVFVELMEEIIQSGKQVLYLLPEIALTAQIVGRLQKHFGDKIIVYHSKFNNNERVEIWKETMSGTPIILGARSALFLPFKDLGLILVDEEHDPSYKQGDPAPRYNARDTAVYMSYLYNAKILLGTATPSLETYRNVQQKKYGLVEMKNRFGGLAMPKILIVDAAEETRRKRMKSHFTQQLLDALQETLDNGEQAILFQNRRGYAPVYRCNSCGWTVECIDCDVSLTYHKYSNDLHCHYCSYHQKMPKLCGACGATNLVIQGFGTEKIEDELKIYLPDVRVMRMDWDTVKGKSGHERIIQLFEKQEVDILVGTQMVTKGLDFDNVGLVGVLSADQLLHFPDFRASERAFQLLTQVSGRAGRKKKQGRVFIQAFDVTNPVLHEVQHNDFARFIKREMRERHDFLYPPFYRIIKIQLKHKKDNVVSEAANFLAERLRLKLGHRVLGPAAPGIARVRGLYLMDIMIKLGLNSKGLQFSKDLILEAQQELKLQKGLSSVRVLVNVDPY